MHTKTDEPYLHIKISVHQLLFKKYLINLNTILHVRHEYSARQRYL